MVGSLPKSAIQVVLGVRRSAPHWDVRLRRPPLNKGVEAVEKPQNLDDDRKEAMRVIMRRDLTRFISDRFEKAYIEPQAL